MSLGVALGSYCGVDPMLSNVLVIPRIVALTCIVDVQHLVYSDRPPKPLKGFHEKKQEVVKANKATCIMLVIPHIFRPVCRDHVE